MQLLSFLCRLIKEGIKLSVKIFQELSYYQQSTQQAKLSVQKVSHDMKQSRWIFSILQLGEES
jgi:hypothetical protein